MKEIKMDYSIKKIYRYIPIKKGGPFFTDTGWRFSPVTYKTKKYVVELEIKLQYQSDIADNVSKKIEPISAIICSIYEYNTQKKLFKKRKGKLLYFEDVTYLKIDEDKEFNLSGTSETEFQVKIERIIKIVLQGCENKLEQEIMKNKS